MLLHSLQPWGCSGRAARAGDQARWPGSHGVVSRGNEGAAGDTRRLFNERTACLLSGGTQGRATLADLVWGWGCVDKNKAWTLGGWPSRPVRTRFRRAGRVIRVLLRTVFVPAPLRLDPCRLAPRALPGNRNQQLQRPSLQRGVGPEQSSPSLDKGLKYPPGPWPTIPARPNPRHCHRHTPSRDLRPWS